MSILNELKDIKKAMDESLLKKMYPDFFSKYEFGGYAIIEGVQCYEWKPKK